MFSNFSTAFCGGVTFFSFKNLQKLDKKKNADKRLHIKLCSFFKIELIGQLYRIGGMFKKAGNSQFSSSDLSNIKKKKKCMRTFYGKLNYKTFKTKQTIWAI